jgi:cytochrome c-type biogenesis protein CcmH
MNYAFSLLILFFSLSAHAVQPDEILKDPLLESRARAISQNLRCMVCQGEDIDESNAELAGDLRKLVRARLVAGDTDAQVTEYVRARYGDQVLLRPPLQGSTLLLWLFPFIVLGGGFWLARRAQLNGGG